MPTYHYRHFERAYETWIVFAQLLGIAENEYSLDRLHHINSPKG